MTASHRIKAVTPLPPFVLRITWTNGKSSEVDVSGPIESLEAYAPLADPDFFRQAVVGEWGWDVVWPGDIAMAADRLYQRSLEQSGKAFPTDEFRAWMARNGLSLTTAAKALGLTRRTITAYSSGMRPIPLIVGLACTGWEAKQRKAA